MLTLITCGDSSWKIIFIFLMPVSIISGNYIMTLFSDTLFHGNKSYPGISMFRMFLGMTLGGCLYFATYGAHSKKDQAPSKRHKSIPRLSKKRVERRQQLLNVLILAGLSALDFIGSFGMNFFSVARELSDLLKLLQFALYSVLLVKVLHIEIQRHHYVSMALCFIAAIAMFFGNRLVIADWLALAVIIVFDSLLSMKAVGEKWLMQGRMVDVFGILLLEGLFGIFYTLIWYCLELLFCSDDYEVYCNELKFFSQATLNELYYCLVNIVVLAFYNVFMFLTIKFFLPTHLIVAQYCGTILRWVISVSIESKLQPWTLAGLIVIVISSLIYNELVILHFCKMEYNTRVMIEKRGMKEVEDNEQEKMLIIQSVFELKVTE